ncbi:hypothetical protein EL456_00300 [Enterococcus faecalis]|nr:hypothetical protein [Enterococcus faecalis]
MGQTIPFNILPSITDKVNVFLHFQKIDFHLFFCAF